MSTRRFVFLDPDCTGEGWLFVVVEATTGVFCQQQYGRTACRQGQVGLPDEERARHREHRLPGRPTGPPRS